MATHMLDLRLVPVASSAETTTEGAQEACTEILSVAVEVLATASNALHHVPLSLKLCLRLIKRISWRCWVDCTDERVVELERLVIAESNG